MTILASVNNKTVMPGITPIADVPDAPTIGTATAGGASGSITFTAATTGGIPTTYTATSSPGSVTGTGSSSPVTVSGLTPGTTYTFTVTAGNSTGTSPASAASNSFVPEVPVAGAFDALASVTVPSGGVASVTFAGIPSGYKHLQLRSFVREASGDYSFYAQFNGDTANNSAYHQLYSDNTSTPGAAASTSQAAAFLGVTGTGANIFSASVTDVLDYQNVNKYKTLRTLHGFDANGSGRVRYISALWQSTNPINSITLIVPGGSGFTQYSQFALYGVK